MDPVTECIADHGFSAVIVAYQSGEDLRHCVRLLLAESTVAQIILVNNGSEDDADVNAVSAHPRVHVISRGLNDGFAGGAHRGAAAASSEFLLFLNPDVFVEPGCVDTLMNGLRTSRPAVLLAPRIDELNGGRAEYGFTVDWVGDLVGLSAPGKPLYLSGCALAMSRELYLRLGGFDPSFFMFCEDLDLCWRALLEGCEIRVVPEAVVRHRGGGSTPGGYVREGRIQVTAFRFGLRERNALATLIHCAPASWLLLVVPYRLLRLAVALGLAIVTRKWPLVRALSGGVKWNIRRFPQTMRRRSTIRVNRATRSKVFWDRVLHDLVAFRVLLEHGFPQLVDHSES
jgi:N-acetylglucosaminyl-diphospho-decaprenol L-rhamnosyltransferase